jgi:hypothetical protein
MEGDVTLSKADKQSSASNCFDINTYSGCVNNDAVTDVDGNTCTSFYDHDSSRCGARDNLNEGSVDYFNSTLSCCGCHPNSTAVETCTTVNYPSECHLPSS